MITLQEWIRMTKKEIIQQLRAAKAAHIQWRAYAQAIVGGFSVDQNHVPVIHTNCRFGQWYYGKGQMLSNLAAYSAIDGPHAMLHQIYMEIYKLKFSKAKRSWFKSKAKVEAETQAKADELMKNLVTVSETLLESISMVEQEVIAMSDEELALLN